MLQMQLAALALAATTLVAGCGGSSKTGSRATTTATTVASTPTSTIAAVNIAKGQSLTRAEWIAKGDAICARTKAKLRSSTVKTQKDFARLLPQAAGYERAEAIELSKLVPPVAMASDWRQIVTGIQKFGEFTARAGEYAQVNNINAAGPTLAAGDTTQQQFIAIAKRDGFKFCSLT